MKSVWIIAVVFGCVSILCYASPNIMEPWSPVEGSPEKTHETAHDQVGVKREPRAAHSFGFSFTGDCTSTEVIVDWPNGKLTGTSPPQIGFSCNFGSSGLEVKQNGATTADVRISRREITVDSKGCLNTVNRGSELVLSWTVSGWKWEAKVKFGRVFGRKNVCQEANAIVEDVVVIGRAEGGACSAVCLNANVAGVQADLEAGR